jgi:hypothetical protein
MPKTGFLAVLLALSSLPAQAATVADTMTKWGAIGTWRVACDTAATRADGTVRYTTKPGGGVVLSRDFGDGSGRDDVTAARVTPEGWLELKVVFHGVAANLRDRTYALRKIEPGVIQAVYNYGANGEYSVRDGKFTSNGSEAPPQHKCD